MLRAASHVRALLTGTPAAAAAVTAVVVVVVVAAAVAGLALGPGLFLLISYLGFLFLHPHMKIEEGSTGGSLKKDNKIIYRVSHND